ncbi:hypothetical protein [Kozakia baliensis]|uniref:hypothetical protein n=1 Tax=Kozakia baliensis TaxID=153496 RepID=UPI00049569C4|nr:hypothetical protein [Kozakia baliensis]
MRKENIKNTIGFLTGASDIVAIIGSLKRTAFGPFERFGNAVRPGQVPSLPTDSTDPRERFKVAARTHAVTEPEIGRRTRMTAWLFWLPATAGFAFIGLALANACNHDFNGTVTTGCAMSMCFMLALKHGFANYQFRNRALLSFREYLNEANLLPKFKKEGGRS